MSDYTKHSLQIVTFEQAKRLKELGFDWDTERYYHNQGECLDDDADKYSYNWNSSDIEDLSERLTNGCEEADICSAPTVALALKWFGVKKKICLGIIPVDAGLDVKNQSRHIEYCPTIRRISDGFFICHDFKSVETYEAAESTLLDKLLTNLTEKTGGKLYKT